MPKKSSKKQTTSFQRRAYKSKGDISDFAKICYQIVKKIPKGKVLTYKQVAKLAGSPRAWRAVGNILNKSASWRIKIPCHRVIGSDGKIGGYNKGTKKKAYLLKREGVVIWNGRICKLTKRR